MKKILLPTDFSDNSINAINYAVNLFKDDNCAFYLLNVFKIPYFTNEELMEHNTAQLAALEDEMYVHSKEELNRLLEKLPKNPKHSFETISDYNLFNLAVHQVTTKKEIDLIVMGTKGATGAKEIFMGSNTSDTIMRNACSVVAIPEHSRFASPKEIVFPTDYEISYSHHDLKPLIDLAKKNDSFIRVLHFSENDELEANQVENKELLDTLLKDIHHEYYTLSSIDFEDGINCFVQSRANIDMIVIIGRHYGFFERLFFKPKVRSLSFHTKVPLFVVHHENKS